MAKSISQYTEIRCKIQSDLILTVFIAVANQHEENTEFADKGSGSGIYKKNNEERVLPREKLHRAF
jgi:hypothetical protein